VPHRALVTVAFSIGLGAACVDEGGLAFGAPVPDAGVATDAGPPEDLEGFVTWQMQRGHIPGLAAAIVRDGSIAWVGTWGFADVEAAAPVTEDTLFAVASISKTVAGTVLLTLVEEGLVDLDARVDEVVPYAVVHPAHPDDAVTVRSLLTHTSGLADSWLVLGRAGNPGDPETSLRAFAEGYVTPGGAFYEDGNWGEAAPGTDYAYCNAAFALVGDVVEAASGRSFRTLSDERVFGPLGMDGSGWFLADVDAGDLAVLYTWSRGTGYAPLDETGVANYPATNLRTSVRDLARFLAMHAGGGALDGARVLDAATVDAIRTRQIPSVARSQGLVWSYDHVGTHDYLAHGGATLGGSAWFGYRVDDGVGVVMMSNSDAYVLRRVGVTDGAEALDAIRDRLDAEAP
jgi:CubicO group peptidase (beta-lactamase class C family)